MSEPGFAATIVEVFPMRLAGQVLVDITLEVAGEGDFDPPRPDDTLVLEAGDRRVELAIWAVPRVPQPEGARRVNVQFRREDVADCMPEEGMRVRVGPGAGA